MLKRYRLQFFALLQMSTGVLAIVAIYTFHVRRAIVFPSQWICMTGICYWHARLVNFKGILLELPEDWARKWEVVEVYGGPDNPFGYCGLVYKIAPGAHGYWLWPFRRSKWWVVEKAKLLGIRIAVWMQIIK